MKRFLRPERLLKSSMLFLFSGGAAVYRCENWLIFIPALAGEGGDLPGLFRIAL
jgi:hypothetical protein